MTDDDKRLIDDLYDASSGFFLESISTETKEILIKQGIENTLEEILEGLNKIYKDVHFKTNWGLLTYKCTEDGHALDHDLYDRDCGEYEDLYGDTSNYYLDDQRLRDLTLKLEYFWERKCNLGCNHRTKRFRIFTTPKIMEIISNYMVGMPLNVIVKTYLPDFFYDPITGAAVPPKRGRPRKLNRP